MFHMSKMLFTCLTRFLFLALYNHWCYLNLLVPLLKGSNLAQSVSSVVFVFDEYKVSFQKEPSDLVT